MAARRFLAAVVLVTVTHESAHAIDPFVDGVEQLRRDSSHRIELIVVDNASRDETVPRLRARGVEPLLAENGGWNAGNNRGLERCPSDADFVLLINPDVVLSAAALDAMLAALDREGASAACPWLRRRGVERAAARPTYGRADAFLGAFGLRRLREARLARRLGRDGSHRLAGAYAEGSCLLIRRDVAERLAPLDESFFVFFDDVDLARRMDDLGAPVLLVGAALAEELDEKGSRAAPGASADEERVARYLLYLDAELRYYAKWYGPSFARAVARWRRAIDLRLYERRWRRRYGIKGLRARGLPVIERFLAADPDRRRT